LRKLAQRNPRFVEEWRQLMGQRFPHPDILTSAAMFAWFTSKLYARINVVRVRW
jgi:hypothetical protein